MADAVRLLFCCCLFLWFLFALPFHFLCPSERREPFVFSLFCFGFLLSFRHSRGRFVETRLQEVQEEVEERARCGGDGEAPEELLWVELDGFCIDSWGARQTLGAALEEPKSGARKHRDFVSCWDWLARSEEEEDTKKKPMTAAETRKEGGKRQQKINAKASSWKGTTMVGATLSKLQWC